jgi:HEAT repeats
MKRWRIIAITAIALFVGWFALQRALNREPRYQDRTLTQWLEVYHYSIRPHADYSDIERLQRSTNAIKQIGSNAIPFLLKKLSAKENRVGHAFKSWVGKQRLIQFHFTDYRLENLLGLNGFWVLGKDAMCAVPALTKLTKHPDKQLRCFALNSLECINPERETFLPILIQTLHDPDPEVRAISARMLRKLYPEEAEKAGVYKMFPLLRVFDRIR